MSELEKNKVSGQAPEKEAQERKISASEARDVLDKYDGFDILLAPMASFLDRFSPENPGKKKRFLQDEDAIEERKALRERLKAYTTILSQAGNSDEKEAHKAVRAIAQGKLESAEDLINGNLSTILNEARDLEQTYRELDLFFRNAEPQKAKNLTLLSVHPDVLLDADSDMVYSEIEKRITDQSRAVDQKKAYSMLVIPNLWKSKQPKNLIERYTKLAGAARMTFLTDFADCDTVEDALAERESKKWQGITGSELHHAHAAIFANHLVLRGKYDNLGEENDVHGSPAMAIAGKMYSEKISQPIMGEQNGAVTGAEGLVFHTVQDTVADLSDEGLNAMMHAYEKDMAYEACTAFTGGEYALKRYAVVRTFDYVNRVLRHYLGKVTGQALDRQRANLVRDTIQDFLDQLAEQKIITKGSVTQFDWNSRVPDRIDIDISIIPLWAVRTFVYALTAQNQSTDVKEKM
ncbi:MAG: hypothetical protein KA479_09600 [Saprospiraceae bacterium]|jgi:hypothetical protein|nr:hypothetical protein [Saprospiraceae bacterium]